MGQVVTRADLTDFSDLREYLICQAHPGQLPQRAVQLDASRAHRPASEKSTADTFFDGSCKYIRLGSLQMEE
jgi:hypothetical protein